jgi:hypothetical protein
VEREVTTFQETNNLLNKINNFRKNKHFLPLIIIFLLGLLPLSYFHSGSEIFGADTGGYLFQKLYPYLWDNIQTGTGFYNWYSPLRIPYEIFYKFLNIIGVSLPFSQILLLCILFVGAGMSMYFFVTSLLSENAKRHFIATGAAIFYMFNPYSMFIWSPWGAGISFLVAYASYPLVFALFIRGLRSKKTLQSGIVFAVGSLIFVAGNDNPPFTIITIFSLLLYLAFHLLFISKNTQERIAAFRFAFIAMALYILVNLWWIATVIPDLGSISQNISTSNPLGILQNFSSYSSILNVLRMYGYPGWQAYFLGRPSFSEVPTLIYNPFFIFASLLPPIIFGLALMLKNRWVKEKGIAKMFLFFFPFYLLALFLSKGVQPPLGGVYLWLFEHLPGFEIFRAVFVKFGIMIGLSGAILFGISLFILHQRVENIKIAAIKRWRLSKILVAALILLILVTNYSFFTGGVVQPFYHTIPSYYSEAATWINSQTQNFNIFQFYGGISKWVSYNWGDGDTYIGTDVDPMIFQVPIIHGDDNSLGNYIKQQVANNSTVQIDKLLSLMNVKYVLLHDDYNSTAASWYPPPQVFQEGLSFQQNISSGKAFGGLVFYTNGNWKPLEIYATPNAIVVQNGFDGMAQIVQQNSFVLGDMALLLSDQLSSQQQKTLSGDSFSSNSNANVSLTYETIDPTKYIVHVNASQPFFIVLDNSFDNNWVAYVNGEQIQTNQHFMANGYANAWYINKTGVSEVVLEFWPQQLFYIGTTISVTTLICCLIYLSKNKIKALSQRLRRQNSAHKASMETQAS